MSPAAAPGPPAPTRAPRLPWLGPQPPPPVSDLRQDDLPQLLRGEVLHVGLQVRQQHHAHMLLVDREQPQQHRDHARLEQGRRQQPPGRSRCHRSQAVQGRNRRSARARPRSRPEPRGPRPRGGVVFSALPLPEAVLEHASRPPRCEDSGRFGGVLDRSLSTRVRHDA